MRENPHSLLRIGRKEDGLDTYFRGLPRSGHERRRVPGPRSAGRVRRPRRAPGPREHAAESLRATRCAVPGVEDVAAARDLPDEVLGTHDAHTSVFSRRCPRPRGRARGWAPPRRATRRRAPSTAAHRLRGATQLPPSADPTTVDGQVAAVRDEIALERTHADRERARATEDREGRARAPFELGASRTTTGRAGATRARRARHPRPWARPSAAEPSHGQPTPRPVISARRDNPKQMNEAMANGIHGRDRKAPLARERVRDREDRERTDAVDDVEPVGRSAHRSGAGRHRPRPAASATTWAATSHRQNQSPAWRLAIHRTNPKSQPTEKTPTTTKPIHRWSSLTERHPSRRGQRPQASARRYACCRRARRDPCSDDVKGGGPRARTPAPTRRRRGSPPRRRAARGASTSPGSSPNCARTSFAGREIGGLDGEPLAEPRTGSAGSRSPTGAIGRRLPALAGDRPGAAGGGGRAAAAAPPTGLTAASAHPSAGQLRPRSGDAPGARTRAWRRAECRPPRRAAWSASANRRYARRAARSPRTR